MEIADARPLFSPAGTYLNTATYGLPPRTAVAELETALDEWRHGRTGFDGWNESVGRARTAFARLARVDAGSVAIGSAVSGFAGLVAAALAPGARVLAVDGDFTSVLFPFLAQAPRGVEVELVPLDRLAEALGPRHDLVAFSVVQSADGRVADVDAIVAAAAAHEVRTFADTTQSTGWLALDNGRFDYTACAGYKWLLAPRGTAYFTVRPELRDGLIPHAAGWYAGDVVPDSYYGAPLRLARDARRFDLSPAWHCWVGAAPAVELLAELGPERIGAHDVALANRLRDGLGMPPAGSAIVSVGGLPDGAAEALRAAGVMAAGRGGALRLSCHLYTTEEDVDRALDVLRTSTPAG
ncbi:MAG TPA: aminotransferase class V-fold PLP-dependent enzyme [Solirubrobacteraceae bacterium]|jgi:selenocysteine lyase/cysteine desulfurase|nr:aminotransferase class V-fold PLP-dependent enzyme [Solirubrobacteraceae bacterium]